MKKLNINKYLLAFGVALAIAGGSASAAAPVVKAQLDSANILMGKMTTLRVTVDQEPSLKGHFPFLRTALEKGYVGVCGDSVELRAPVKVDTVRQNNALSIRYDIPVQSFDSGYYKLPELEFVAGVDTFRSNSVALKVYPVAKVTADTPIADYANVADPENPSIFDSLPDWMVKYWWILLIVLAAAGVGFWLWRRYSKEGTILPKKPEPTPYESAIAALRELKEKKLWENGMEKEYFTELTDILRTYLYRRFGINAMEMTSRQILAALTANKETKDKKPMIRQILDMADFVKFAKVRPLPADNIQSLDNAITFVEQTKPLPVEEKADEENAPAKSATQKTTKKKGGKK